MCIDLENVKNGRQYSKCLKSAIACRSTLVHNGGSSGSVGKGWPLVVCFFLKKEASLQIVFHHPGVQMGAS